VFGATGTGSGSGLSTLHVAAKASVGMALMVACVALLHWLAPQPLNHGDSRSVISAGSTSAFTEVSAAPESRKQHDTSEAAAAVVLTEDQTAPTATSVVPRGSTRVRDSLSEEVEILARAEVELRKGRPESALILLNEHEKKFKNGIMAEERTAARIQALCALGRVTEAKALLGKLSSQSLHGKPISQACATAKTVTSDR
jgi:hypothetical protein